MVGICLFNDLFLLSLRSFSSGQVAVSQWLRTTEFCLHNAGGDEGRSHSLETLFAREEARVEAEATAAAALRWSDGRGGRGRDVTEPEEMAGYDWAAAWFVMKPFRGHPEMLTSGFFTSALEHHIRYHRKASLGGRS